MSGAARTLRVVVVDDHPVFREGLAAMLDALPDIDVVGEAADGLQAVAMTEANAPDVVVMDLHMPELDGVEATRRITATCADTAVLVLTMLDDDASVAAALDAGARGFLVKEADRTEIVRAIAAVASGQAIFGASLARRLLSSVGIAVGRSSTQVGDFVFLTDREHEVLDLVALGLTNAAIAARLVISDKTVRNHVSNIFAKLHITDRAAAVARARDAGYGTGTA
jgi:DNA-binding NarL/FixJ family response regulator